jgi:hypothetical protein
VSITERAPSFANAAAAQKWIDAGLSVFPCCASTKKPKVGGWREPAKHASAWKAHWARSPLDMPGLDCAYAGIVVIDCDCRENKDGEANFRALCHREGVDLSNVPMAKTPTGGRHFYFKSAGERVANSAGVLGTGIDVRGDGGFVVVPGACRADGRAYVADHSGGLDDFIFMVAQGELPVLPNPLLRLMKTLKSNTANILTFPPPAPTGADEAVVAGIKLRWDIADACVRIALSPVGSRNDTLNKEAYIAGLRASAGALDPIEAAKQLSEAARHTGLADDEIENTIQGAFRRAAATGQAGGAIRPSMLASAALPWERTTTHSLKRSFKNGMLALQTLGVEARRNTFSDKIILSNTSNLTPLPADHVGTLTDNAVNLLRKVIQDTVGFDPGREHLLDAIKSIAEEARYNPVEEWLSSIHWDGIRRLHDCLPRLTGAPPTKLFRHAGAVLLLGMVMRAQFPGSKFDLCVVLEGEQGCGKSSLLRALATAPGEGYFVDAPGLVAMDNKTRAELVAGKWLVELAELSGLAKSETEGVKAFLSQSTDQYRPPYGAVAVDRPRRCIFVATTNARTYLPDATGNRRFLPVPCLKIDLKAVMSERDQLFAEAKVMVSRMLREPRKSGRIHRGHALPQDLAAKFGLPAALWREAAALADERRVVDPVEEALPDIVKALAQSSRHRLQDGRIFIRSADVLSRLRLEMHGQVKNNGLAGWMAALGWSSVRYRTGSGQERGYAM